MSVKMGVISLGRVWVHLNKTHLRFVIKAGLLVLEESTTILIDFPTHTRVSEIVMVGFSMSSPPSRISEHLPTNLARKTITLSFPLLLLEALSYHRWHRHCFCPPAILPSHTHLITGNIQSTISTQRLAWTRIAPRACKQTKVKPSGCTNLIIYSKATCILCTSEESKIIFKILQKYSDFVQLKANTNDNPGSDLVLMRYFPST